MVRSSHVSKQSRARRPPAAVHQCASLCCRRKHFKAEADGGLRMPERRLGGVSTGGTCSKRCDSKQHVSRAHTQHATRRVAVANKYDSAGCSGLLLPALHGSGNNLHSRGHLLLKRTWYVEGASRKLVLPEHVVVLSLPIPHPGWVPCCCWPKRAAVAHAGGRVGWDGRPDPGTRARQIWVNEQFWRIWRGCIVQQWPTRR